MEIKLSSQDMEQAVLEYVSERVFVPQGFKLEVSTSYISGVSVYMERVEEPEPAPAEEPTCRDHITIPAGAD